MLDRSDQHQFREGQTVRVRSFVEILKTLDAEHKLDGLPFMPEMEQFCGCSFQVYCLPTKTCIEGVGFRPLHDIVFLENLRCDGSAHDGCQRDCLLFWKPAWLSAEPQADSSGEFSDVFDNNSVALKTRKGDRYFCQSTELRGAASQYSPDMDLSELAMLRRMVIDVWRGEMSLAAFVRKVFFALLWRVKALFGMKTDERVLGQLQKTETLSLGLKAGDWVEVKSRKEIQATLDTQGKNRGLLFDPPMLEYCGQPFQVEKPLEKIILEDGGRMVTLKNTVLLKNNICTAHGCPRANRPFWREIWLTRIEPPTGT